MWRRKTAEQANARSSQGFKLPTVFSSENSSGWYNFINLATFSLSCCMFAIPPLLAGSIFSNCSHPLPMSSTTSYVRNQALTTCLRRIRSSVSFQLNRRLQTKNFKFFISVLSSSKSSHKRWGRCFQLSAGHNDTWVDCGLPVDNLHLVVLHISIFSNIPEKQRGFKSPT